MGQNRFPPHGEEIKSSVLHSYTAQFHSIFPNAILVALKMSLFNHSDIYEPIAGSESVAYV